MDEVGKVGGGHLVNIEHTLKITEIFQFLIIVEIARTDLVGGGI